jgi:hypothetical protein
MGDEKPHVIGPCDILKGIIIFLVWGWLVISFGEPSDIDLW